MAFCFCKSLCLAGNSASKISSKICGDFGFITLDGHFVSTQIFEIVYMKWRFVHKNAARMCVWVYLLSLSWANDCLAYSIVFIDFIALIWFQRNAFVFVKISYIIILYFIFVYVLDNGVIWARPCKTKPRAKLVFVEKNHLNIVRL